MDDGPNDLLNQFNDLFIQYNARATYFLIGQNVSSAHKAELTRAVENGMELGNHSYSHTNFNTAVNSGTMTTYQVKEDFEKCNRVVYNTVGYKMKLLRLPNLAFNEMIVNNVCRNLGMPCISRTLPGTGDTDADSTAETIIARFLKDGELLEGADYTANDGAIVLCHMKQKTLDALRVIVPALIENGYQLVTVSEMFEAFGYDSVPYDGNLGRMPIARR